MLHLKSHEIRFLLIGGQTMCPWRCQRSPIAADKVGKSQGVDLSSIAWAWGYAHSTSQSVCSLRPAQTSWRWSIQRAYDQNKQQLQTLGGKSCRQGYLRLPASQDRPCWAAVRALYSLPAGRHCCDSLGQVTWILRLFISSIIKMWS